MYILDKLNTNTPNIKISNLIKNGLIQIRKKSKAIYITENSINKIKITIISDMRDLNKMSLKLKYQIAEDSPLITLEIKITKPMFFNYDKRENSYYFCCPYSGKFTKVLFLSNLTHIFVHRDFHRFIGSNREPVINYLPITNNELLERFKSDKAEYFKQKKMKLDQELLELKVHLIDY